MSVESIFCGRDTIYLKGVLTMDSLEMFWFGVVFVLVTIGFSGLSSLIVQLKNSKKKQDADETPEDSESEEKVEAPKKEDSKVSEPFRFNVSEGQANYSQRKSKFVHIQKGQYGENKIDWTCTCNVHSLIMAFLYSGWICPASTYEREPDAFADFIVQECLKDGNWFKTKMYNLWQNWYEGSPDAYSPLELHDVLAHYACEWFKCSTADRFNSAADIKDIIRHLYEERVAVPTSIKWGGLLGHIICIVGLEATSEDDLVNWLAGKIDKCPITKVIYDDPFGFFDVNTNKYDGNKSGNDNELDYDFFVKHWKDIANNNKKYAHFLGKPVVVV